MASLSKSQRAEVSNLFLGVVRELAGSERFVEKNVAVLVTGRYDTG